MDPTTLSQAEITTPAYWRTPFSALAASPAGCIEFMVLDIEPSSHPPKTANRGRSLLADAQVTPTASNMDSDAIFHTRTHLGAILKPGDTVLGYLLTSSNFNSNAWEELDPSKVPQVVLVRKTYPERRKKSKPRPWRLKTMAKEVDQEGDHAGLGRAKGGSGKKGGMSVEQQRAEADYEMFVRDIEEDAELRQAINLYKARPKRADPNEMEVESETASVAGTELDDDFPQVRSLRTVPNATQSARRST
jgi:nonsense-mediated mRNA decay protein 3